MKKITVNQRRNKYWFLNAILFYLLRLNPFRDKKLWIFGCWEGQKYDDNARYLFEFINANAKEISPVWFTCRKDIYDSLTSKGYKVQLIGTRKAYLTQLKAGAVFYTNGMDDFGNIGLFYGAKIFSLWHGMIIRKGYYNRFKHSGIHYCLKRLKDKIYNATYFDFITGTSEYAINNLCSTFNETKKKALLTGQPRNDVFNRQINYDDVFKTIRLSDHSKIILYMPTHREYEDQTIENTIKRLDENERFVNYIKANNVFVIVKPHYLTKIVYTPLSSNILIVEGDEIKSTQELLAIADVLITDYSSCIIDFSIKNQPSIVYATDLDSYVDKLGLLEPWDHVYPEIAIGDHEELVTQIIKSIELPNECMDVTNLFNSYYQAESIKGSLFSYNVYKLANKIVCKGEKKK